MADSSGKKVLLLIVLLAALGGAGYWAMSSFSGPTVPERTIPPDDIQP